ncbi:hypothetical protein HPB51_018230 [Rhipicephalus microplus]|uniref:Uncharacterized protein n=1 Tax=Rhipicephalus microplus TaxID=6941 RepID=A0A9J6E351_RHIMP|nr:hypothetical protein HPB51_018230 [Rhipicephalus microplus]
MLDGGQCESTNRFFAWLFAWRLLHARPGRHRLLTTSSGHGHRRDRIAVVAHRPAHLVLPGPAACRPVLLPAGTAAMDPARPSSARGRRARRRHAAAPTGSPGTTPSSATSARDSGFFRGGPFIAGVDCVALVGTGWFRSTGVLTPFCPGATTPAGPGWRRSVGLSPGPGGAAVPGRQLQHEVQRGRLDVSRADGAPPRRIRTRRSCERANLCVLGVRLAAHVPALVPPLPGEGHTRAIDGDASPVALACATQRLRPSAAWPTTCDATSTRLGRPAPLASARLPGMCAMSARHLPTRHRPRRALRRRQQHPGLRDASGAYRPLMPHLRCGPRRLRPPGRGPLRPRRSPNRLPSCTCRPAVRRRPWARPPSPVRRHHLLPQARPPPCSPCATPESTSSPTPHISVPTPAGVPVDSPVLGSPRSPDPASPRPSSSARQVLVPYDFGPSSSSYGASPAPRGSSAASPVGDAAFLLDDDNTISYDVAVYSPPLDAGSSPVVLPGSPVSPASSPSPPASVDEAAADPDEVPEHPETDSDPPDATGPHAPPRGPGTPAPLLAAGPAHRRVMGPMRGSMDAGRRLGCRGGASPTGPDSALPGHQNQSATPRGISFLSSSVSSSAAAPRPTPVENPLPNKAEQLIHRWLSLIATNILARSPEWNCQLLEVPRKVCTRRTDAPLTYQKRCGTQDARDHAPGALCLCIHSSLLTASLSREYVEVEEAEQQTSQSPTVGVSHKRRSTKTSNTSERSDEANKWGEIIHEYGCMFTHGRICATTRLPKTICREPSTKRAGKYFSTDFRDHLTTAFCRLMSVRHDRRSAAPAPRTRHYSTPTPRNRQKSDVFDHDRQNLPAP